MAPQKPTVQTYNEMAEQLINDLKSFFLFEKNGLSHVKIQSHMNGKMIEPTINFYHSNEKDNLLKRLSEFGFPNPTINGTIANFKDVMKNRIPEHGRDINTANVSQESLKEIFDALISWGKEKNFKHRIVIGKGFVRTQTSDFAKKAKNFLQAKFRGKYEIKQIKEDLFFKLLIGNSQSSVAQTIEPYEEVIKKSISEIFGIPIYETLMDGNEIIVAFETEEQLLSAKRLCELYSFESEVKGQTLVFTTPQGLYLSLKDVSELHADYDASKDVPDASVDTIVANKADQNLAVQPEEELLPLFTGLIGVRLAKRLIEQATFNQKEKANRKQSSEALELITLIGKKFGITYEKNVSPTVSQRGTLLNGRYITWKEPLSKVNQVIGNFSKLGYDVRSSRNSFFFQSIFPVHSNELLKENLVPVQPAPEPDKSQPIVSVPQPQQAVVQSVRAVVELSEQQVSSIISTIPQNVLIAEVQRRDPSFGEINLSALSNADLIEEIRRRGSTFGQELFQVLFQR